MGLELGADRLAEVAAGGLDVTRYLLESLLEDYLAKAVPTFISELSMEVELDFIAHETTGHRENVHLFHLRFDFGNAARPVGPNGQIDKA